MVLDEELETELLSIMFSTSSKTHKQGFNYPRALTGKYIVVALNRQREHGSPEKMSVIFDLGFKCLR